MASPSPVALRAGETSQRSLLKGRERVRGKPRACVCTSVCGYCQEGEANGREPMAVPPWNAPAWDLIKAVQAKDDQKAKVRTTPGGCGLLLSLFCERAVLLCPVHLNPRRAR